MCDSHTWFQYNEEMEKEIRQRLKWIQQYKEENDAGLVCRRCGISTPTLRKWVGRFEEDGVEGLRDHSKRPHSLPNKKIGNEEESLNLGLRKKRNLGER